MNRRKMLSSMGVSVLGGTLFTSFDSQRAAASETAEVEVDAPADDGLVDLLFVQNAKGMRFDNGVLTMVMWIRTPCSSPIGPMTSRVFIV